MSQRNDIGITLLMLIIWFAMGGCVARVIAQHTATPRYLHLRGTHTVGAHYAEHPCSFGASLYQGGRYVGPVDAFPQADDRLVDYHEQTIHNIYYRDYGTVLYIYRDFSLGADGHIHSIGAYMVDCRFTR